MREENKLIAKFMGIESYQFRNYNMFIFDEDNHRTEIDLHYHTSWDWLMPVIEKIDEICGIDLHEWNEYIDNSLCSKSLNTTYSACIEFIKWYNENK